MNHRFQCQCGALHGQIEQTQLAVRGVCYCRDCRAYSNFLGKGVQNHDALGGADFVATQARYVTFTGGKEHLACVSLSPKGALRWYASCCYTAICNTSRDWKLPYTGFVTVCLKADLAAFDRAFPDVQMRVNTDSAKGPVPPAKLATTLTLMRFIPRVMMGRLGGSYRKTPFFDSTGTPVVEVKTLSLTEREAAYVGA